MFKKNKEVALLASFESADNDTAGKEKDILKGILKKKNIGIRQIHFRFNFHKTPEFHRKHAFLYDSSRPVLERSGFKHGIGFPYKYLDMVALRKGNLPKSVVWEMPLNFCDEQLKISRFQNYPAVKAKEMILELFKPLKITNGFLNLDFALSNFADIKYNADIFRFTLKLIRKNNTFCAPLGEVIEWWKNREEVYIKETYDSFFIYFPKELDNFTLKVLGKVKITEIQGLEAKIEHNKIYFEKIKAKSGAKIAISTK